MLPVDDTLNYNKTPPGGMAEYSYLPHAMKHPGTYAVDHHNPPVGIRVANYTPEPDSWEHDSPYRSSLSYEVGVVGTPRGEELYQVQYYFDEPGTLGYVKYWNWTTTAREEVFLENPRDALLDPSMYISQTSPDTMPIVIAGVEAGYVYHQRRVPGDSYYDPVWIFTGMSREGTPVRVWVWASGDRGLEPTYDAVQDMPPVTAVFIHMDHKRVLSLPPDDPAFAEIAYESKMVLSAMCGQCPCAITPDDRREQIENSSYVEILFTDYVPLPLKNFFRERDGSYITFNTGGALIAFNGPFQEQVFPYTYDPDDDYYGWNMMLTCRNLSTLREMAESVLKERGM